MTRRPRYELVLTGRGKPSAEQIAELAKRAGVRDVRQLGGTRPSWFTRLFGRTPRPA